MPLLNQSPLVRQYRRHRPAGNRKGPGGEKASTFASFSISEIVHIASPCLLFPVCDLEGNEWEEHPQFCLTGEGNSVATKTQQPSAQLPEWHNTLVTNRVMDSGIHRISLLYTLPPNPEIYGRTLVDERTYMRPRLSWCCSVRWYGGGSSFECIEI